MQRAKTNNILLIQIFHIFSLIRRVFSVCLFCFFGLFVCFGFGSVLTLLFDIIKLLVMDKKKQGSCVQCLTFLSLLIAFHQLQVEQSARHILANELCLSRVVGAYIKPLNEININGQLMHFFWDFACLFQHDYTDISNYKFGEQSQYRNHKKIIEFTGKCSQVVNIFQGKKKRIENPTTAENRYPNTLLLWL